MIIKNLPCMLQNMVNTLHPCLMQKEEKEVDSLITAEEKKELLRILQKMYDKLEKEWE